MSVASPDAHKALHIINIGLLLTISVAGLMSWHGLPEQIPIHFRADGTADRFTDDKAELLIVFFAPWLLTAMMYGSAALIPWCRHNPRWINIPNKCQFLDLSPEEQQPFWSLLSGFFYSLAASINLVFLTLISGILQVATGQAQRLPGWSVWPAMVILVVITIVQTIRMITVPYRLTNKRVGS
jgi:hypothetical protein